MDRAGADGGGLRIEGSTRLVGLIGHPVAHSLSPRMQNAGFAAAGIDYAYVTMDVLPERLPAAVEGLRALGFRGFNITLPHKRAIVPLLDEVDEAVALSGAANTVVIDDGKLSGHVTDGTGLVEACREAGLALAGRRIALLGAGGAAGPVALAMAAEGAAEITVVNRTFERAAELVGHLLPATGATALSARPRDALEGVLAGADVVLNVTTLGMGEEDPLPVPAESLDGGIAVIDAVYRPGAETRLVREARARGARVVDGRRMLLYQGVQAQRLWTGREPAVAAMAEALA